MEVITKAVNLIYLQEGLFGLDAAQIEERGEQLYKELFLTKETSGIHRNHDRQKVAFSKERFRHAFYLSPNKDEIDKRRVARIRWILPLITGQVLNSECWLVNDKGIEKLLYICYGLNYVVWLEPQDYKNSWVFSTAYVADREHIREYTGRGKRIAQFNKKEKKGKQKKKKCP